jgi:hypothetical protein
MKKPVSPACHTSSALGYDGSFVGSTDFSPFAHPLTRLFRRFRRLIATAEL